MAESWSGELPAGENSGLDPGSSRSVRRVSGRTAICKSSPTPARDGELALQWYDPRGGSACARSRTVLDAGIATRCGSPTASPLASIGTDAKHRLSIAVSRPPLRRRQDTPPPRVSRGEGGPDAPSMLTVSQHHLAVHYRAWTPVAFWRSRRAPAVRSVHHGGFWKFNDHADPRAQLGVGASLRPRRPARPSSSAPPPPSAIGSLRQMSLRMIIRFEP